MPASFHAPFSAKAVSMEIRRSEMGREGEGEGGGRELPSISYAASNFIRQECISHPC